MLTRTRVTNEKILQARSLNEHYFMHEKEVLKLLNN